MFCTGPNVVESSASCAAPIRGLGNTIPFLRCTASDITCDSRRGSIGGLVTCAKRCLQESHNVRRKFEKNTGGASAPLVQFASCPCTNGGNKILKLSSRQPPPPAKRSG